MTTGSTVGRVQRWEASFQELVDYKRFHGDCNVPHKYKTDPQLGSWVSTQRRTKETMSEERTKRLNSIGFTWKVREAYVSVPWEVRFQELVDYKRVYGNCNVPNGYQPNPPLGTWVYHQRERTSTMSDERKKRLNSIAFTWKMLERPISVGWKVRFQQLVDYKRFHGDCNIPQKYKANQKLGYWVNTQRTNKETMNEERRKRLNSIGFTWKARETPTQETPISVDWKVRFQQLVDYKRFHGDCNVPQKYKTDPQLGSWVSTQRRTKETMSGYKRKQFDSIGFVWRPKTGSKQKRRVRPKKKKARLNEEAAQEDTVFGQQVWDSYFEQLGDFVRKYKHCNVPAQHSELGRWAEEQRQLYERKQIGRGMESNLTDEQEAKLMAVGFVFERTLNIPDDDDTYSL